MNTQLTTLSKYFGYQITKKSEDIKCGKVYFLVEKTISSKLEIEDSFPLFSLEVLHYDVPFEKYTLNNMDEVTEEIFKLLNTLPVYTFDNDNHVLRFIKGQYYKQPINGQIQQKIMKVGEYTRRGPANVYLHTGKYYCRLYHGYFGHADTSIVISEYDGKYAVIPHPNFMNYGFNYVVEKSNGIQ